MKNFTVLAALLCFALSASASTDKHCKMSAGQKHSISIVAQIVLSSSRSLEARFKLPEIKYDLTKSAWSLDWKEGHGYKVYYYDDPQTTLYEDQAKADKGASRCVVHTPYISARDGMTYFVSQNANYFMESFSRSNSPSDGDYFSMTFTNPASYVDQVNVTCVGMDPDKMSLDDLSKEIMDIITFK